MKKSKEQLLSQPNRKRRGAAAGRFIFFLFLIALAGFVFYLGWVQMSIPPQSRVILFSKTGGFESEVYKPGVFLWRWEKCLPENMSILVYPDTTEILRFSGEGHLPSGKLYGDWMGNPEAFRFEYSAIINVRITDEELLALTVNGILTPETYKDYLSDLEKQLEGEVLRLIGRMSVNSPENSDSLSPNDIRITGLEILNIQMERLNIPDMELYHKTASAYWKEIEAKKTVASDILQQRIPLEKEYESRLMILEKYGEVLNRYPVLLDFLRVTADQDLKKTP